MTVEVRKPPRTSPLRAAYRLSVDMGLDPRKILRRISNLPRFLSDLRTLRKQARKSDAAFPITRFYPCLDDWSDQAGSASGHYFHQDLLIARRVFETAPKCHVDVGSRVDGFVAHVAAFRKIVVMDFRQLSNTIPNIEFRQLDLMDTPANQYIGMCDSLSCLHALEHFGLGRYGDPLNFDGYRTGLKNLSALLQSGGRLFLSAPIGFQRIEFNAHRVFSVGHLLDCVSEEFDVERFSFVDDAGDLHENVALSPQELARDFGCTYGCGIFELRKKVSPYPASA
jgi:uncharacterized protein DUF268